MATTATDRRLARGIAAAFLLALGSCAPAGPPEPETPPVVARPAPSEPAPPAPRDSVPDVVAPVPRPPADTARRDTVPPVPARVSGAAPEIRAGLLVGASSAAVGGGDELVVAGAEGGFLGVIPAGEAWEATPGGSGVVLRGARGRFSDRQLRLAPRAGNGLVRAGGRDYRGALILFRDRTGLTVVNRVDLEAYLAGVVGAEMGRRPEGDREALRAQAIVSRTYALRNRNRWRTAGFDYYATVADQVYLGVAGENDPAREAVNATRGAVVTWGGAPIDAFFFSTCGGRTELGTEVFRGAGRPYLRSVPDTDQRGTAYCAESPRYRWREEWTGRELRAALRQGLAAVGAAPAEEVRLVRDVRVAGRTASGRVARLLVTLQDRTVSVESARIRQALRSPSGEILRSTLFSLSATSGGDEIRSLAVEGSGAGHGVGFCQWGAIGRSRGGQRFDAIIAAYFPGTRLERFY
ncbi:MAG TPA: SpoIID/LytB domain-containing protein [Gemmatimonadales bacterium]|nr:SpoIID/LytB domain-containing protein [Gemmatimonadales bacterium]